MIASRYLTEVGARQRMGKGIGETWASATCQSKARFLLELKKKHAVLCTG